MRVAMPGAVSAGDVPQQRVNSARPDNHVVSLKQALCTSNKGSRDKSAILSLPDCTGYSRRCSALLARHWKPFLEIVLLLRPRVLARWRRVETDTCTAILAILFADIDC